jgi:preprotein translocase subunit SecA
LFPNLTAIRQYLVTQFNLNELEILAFAANINQFSVSEPNTITIYYMSATNNLIRKYSTQAQTIISDYTNRFAVLSDQELAAYTPKLRISLLAYHPQQSQLNQQSIPNQSSQQSQPQQLLLEQILPEAFACVREAAYREFGYRHNQEQLIAGIALFNGKLVDLKTGEGKTLTVTLTAYLQALASDLLELEGSEKT